MGVNSAGFSTQQLPATSAGKSLRHATFKGKFQGVIRVATPERLASEITDHSGQVRRAHVRRPACGPRRFGILLP